MANTSSLSRDLVMYDLIILRVDNNKRRLSFYLLKDRNHQKSLILNFFEILFNPHPTSQPETPTPILPTTSSMIHSPVAMSPR